MGTRWRHVLVLGALGAVLVGCGSDARSSATANSSPDAAVSPQDAGLPAGSATLSATQQSAATAFAASWAQQLVAVNAALAGLSEVTIAPVYEDHSDGPVGARAIFQVPAIIPEIQLDLVRLHRSGPETVPSRITNLRTLEMIYLFDGEQVVHVGIVASPSDATDPAQAASAVPLDPEAHRSTDFGGVE
jgi:hypothetical protein